MQEPGPSAADVQVKTVVTGVARAAGEPSGTPGSDDPLVYHIRLRIEGADTTGIWAELYNASALDADPATQPMILSALEVHGLNNTLGRYADGIVVTEQASLDVSGGDLSVSFYKAWPLPASIGFGLGMTALLAATLVTTRARRRQRAERNATQSRLASREAERLRVARDIHDGPLQQITHVASGLPGSRGDTLRDAAADLRALLSGLRPPALDQFGLGAALHDLAQAMARLTPPLTVRVQDDVEDRLDLNTELAVYRITQEALTNASRHGAAGTAWVSVEHHDERLCLVVRDDGAGLPDAFDGDPLDAARLVRDGHLGLAGMAERASILGGTLSLRVGPGGLGSELRLSLPASPVP